MVNKRCICWYKEFWLYQNARYNNKNLNHVFIL